jgi:hypothetical protein
MRCGQSFAGICKYRKGIDKKNLYVHNTSYYDTKAYRVSPGLCPFLFDTAVSAANRNFSCQVPADEIMERRLLIGRY